MTEIFEIIRQWNIENIVAIDNEDDKEKAYKIIDSM